MRGIRLWHAALLLAAHGAALSAVAWRQSETRATMSEIAALADEMVVATDRRDELERRLLGIVERRWVTREAGRRLGLRAPGEEEIVIAPGGAR